MMPKFRAWSKAEKIMSDVKKLDLCNGEIDARSFEETEIEEVELMQSTCLNDKNGNEIFEGDILHGNDGEDFWDVVKYDNDNAVWVRESVYYSSSLNLSENVETLSVVGNIYENPEILR